MLKKVISGGQTGVDRAGLDAAVAAGIPIGGYCAKGRIAEDGCIPEKYPLIELEPINAKRTEKNVIESDGTLILNKGDLSEGILFTYDFTCQHEKPCLIIRLDAERITEPADVLDWLQDNRIEILNVAGPRESKLPGGVYLEALASLLDLFRMASSESHKSVLAFPF